LDAQPLVSLARLFIWECSAMKTLCITGSSPSDLFFIETILTQAGMGVARAAQRDSNLTMEFWHSQVQSRVKEVAKESGPVELGRVWEQLASDLFVANLDQPVWGWSNVESLPVLDFWQAFDPQLRFVLVACSAQRYIADALESGEPMPSIGVLLEQWSSQQMQMLQFYHRFPAKTVLVDIDHCIDNPAGLIKACQQAWQLNLNKVHFPSQTARQFSTMTRFLAEGLSQADTQWQTLQNELWSSATPIGTLWKQSSQVDISAAVRAYREEKDRVDEKKTAMSALERIQHQDTLTSKAELAEHQKKIAELTNQLQASQAQLNALESIKPQLDSKTAELAKLQKDLQESQAKVALTQKEKDQIKSQLDSKTAELAKLQKDLQESQAKSVSLQKEHENAVKHHQETQEEADLLLAQLHQVQEELENYFLKYQESKQELEAADMRWKRMLQRTPEYFDFESAEILSVESTDNESLNWRLVGLDAAGRSIPELKFKTFIEGGVASLELPRRVGDYNVLLRWPAVAAKDQTLTVAVVGDAKTGPKRAETLLQLGRSDWDLVRVIVTALIKAFDTPAMLQRGEGIIADKTPLALRALQGKLEQMPAVFRFDELTLKREQVNPDYEHLWLDFKHVAIGEKRLLDFDFRVSCANVRPKTFGEYPKLEFPEASGRAAISEWFDEAYDDFGPKLELRFSLPQSMDIQVWEQLSTSDRQFLTVLINQMPSLLNELENSGVQVKRGWEDWQRMTQEMRRILAICTAPSIPGAPAPKKTKRPVPQTKRGSRA
jgi:hypothetical protein